MLNNHIPNIQVSWVKEGARMSQMLLSAGANDFGGTLINESISTAAGSQHGQLMRPKEIRRLIRSAGKIPVQRTTLYDKVRIFQNDDGASDCELDKADSRIFGSYHELIQLDKFRYTGLNSPSQAYRSN
jgi:FO synthase subunit 2